MFVVCEGLILWFFLSMKYILHSDYLHVRGGPFSSKIKYNNITRVKDGHSILVGYRILTSRDSIEIFYKTGLIGSVKISPKDKDLFIQELTKRCPHL